MSTGLTAVIHITSRIDGENKSWPELWNSRGRRNNRFYHLLFGGQECTSGLVMPEQYQCRESAGAALHSVTPVIFEWTSIAWIQWERASAWYTTPIGAGWNSWTRERIPKWPAGCAEYKWARLPWSLHNVEIGIQWFHSALSSHPPTQHVVLQRTRVTGRTGTVTIRRVYPDVYWCVGILEPMC